MSAYTMTRNFKRAFKEEITEEIRRQAKRGATVEHIERVIRSQFPSQLWIDWVKVANTEIDRYNSINEA